MVSAATQRAVDWWQELELGMQILDLAEQRALLDSMSFAIAGSDKLPSQIVDAGGVPAEWVTAENSDSDLVVFYVHGGGLCMGSPATHRDLVQRICRATRARALSVDYRLAPENSIPAQVEDTVTCYRWLLQQGTDPKKIAFVGDSAGGGLIVAAMFMAREQGLPLPAVGASISAWGDLTASGESYSKNLDDPFCKREVALSVHEVIYPGGDPKNPYASPVFGDFTGLPPLYLMTGAEELIASDAQTMAERAKAAGVVTKFEAWPGMPHIWPLFAEFLEEGRDAIDRIGAFILEHTDHTMATSESAAR